MNIIDEKLVKNIHVISYVDTYLQTRVHKIVATYLEGLPHIKSYTISKIGTKKPCIIIARNQYTVTLFRKVQKILQYCQTVSFYVNSNTDRRNYHFIPYYTKPYKVIVKKEIADNCLLWE